MVCLFVEHYMNEIRLYNKNRTPTTRSSSHNKTYYIKYTCNIILYLNIQHVCKTFNVCTVESVPKIVIQQYFIRVVWNVYFSFLTYLYFFIWYKYNCCNILLFSWKNFVLMLFFKYSKIYVFTEQHHNGLLNHPMMRMVSNCFKYNII